MESFAKPPSTDYDSDNLMAQKFYESSVSDRTWSECVLQLRKTYKELQSKPIPSAFKSRLEGPSVEWKVFPRLSEASSYANSHTKDCMIFSFEKQNPDSSGQRLFLVTHPHHMWLNHKSRPPDFRCTYEVIQENVPCKLYFDLEYIKALNPTKDGNNLTKIFIKCVIAAMFEVFNIHLQSSSILWLDASTSLKFSSHLIIQDPNVVFQNNVAAGSFVFRLLSSIMSRITNNADCDALWPSTEELKSLLIQKTDEKSIFFCDSGVYTKNRNFRLYLSTKYGKRAPLLLSQNNQYLPADVLSYADKDESIFYDSLITYFRSNKKNLRILPDIQIDASNGIPPHFISTNARKEPIGLTLSGSSPFPGIDDFVLTQVRDLTANGFIRKWTYLKKEEMLVYEIGNYRYCSNIGRYHKSNNIMIVVDMKKRNYYQKCHDPECRAQNYKSVAKPLPLSSYELPDDFFEENCFSQLNTIETDVSSKEIMNNLSKDSEKQSCVNDVVIYDKFFEESFPFTQMDSNIVADKSSNSNNNNLTKTSCSKSDELEQDIQDFAETLSDNFDDIISGGYSYEECSVNSFSNNVSCDTSIEKSLKNQSPDYITSDDEKMMTKAAETLECSFLDDETFSEETIF